MTWTIYQCEEPDFWVRSVQDDMEFGVLRASLAHSEVFCDMFSLCTPTEENGNLDLEESAETLAVLLRLLHSPPSPPIQIGIPHPREHEKLTARIHIREYEPGSVIPLPMLPMLLILADKYILKDSIVGSLHAHLLANASVHPLQVYGMAMRHGLDGIANATSKYLLHPPLSTYTLEDVKVIGSAEGYHKLLLLHAYRVKRLREILLAEDVFPHGYGECPTHGQRTTTLWARSRESIAPKIEAGTDVAAEMSELLDEVHSCKTCFKACSAAIEMLAYKCRRVPKQLDQLPSIT